MGNWSKLKADEKIRVIKFARQNGVSDIKTIRDTYNLYSSGGNLVHKYDAEQVGESQYLQKQDNTNVSNLPTIEPVPLPTDMWLTDQQLAELNHKKALYANEGLNIVSPEFDLLTLIRGLATEPLKIFKTQSNLSSKALKDNSGLIKLQKSVKGHYPDNYNYEAANQLLQKLKEEGYNLDGIDIDKLIQARVENLIDANQNGRLLLHNNDGLITAHDIGKIDDLDSDIYYAMTNFIDKKEGLGNIGKIQYFKDKDGSYHIKMIRSDKPNTQVGRDLYDAIEEAAIQNGVDNTIVAETLLQPEKTVHTMETWFPNREIVSNKGRWDLLNDVTGDRTSTRGMPVWKLHKERPSNLKSLIFDPSIVDENGIMHLGEGMYHSTGGPLYPFSFEKSPFIKTPVVRYDEGGQTYTVKKGDTFSQIAQNVGVSVQDLQKLNPTITNVNRIREGQNINIPTYMFSEIFNTPQSTGLPIPQVQRTQPLQQQKGLKTAGPLDLQELAVRQAYTESRLRPEIVNDKGAYGLFQIMQPALDDYNRVNKTNYTLEDMKDADNNIKVRNWYMDYLSNLGFIDKGDIQSDSVGMYKVLASFNAGAGNVKDALTRAKADGKDIYDSWDWVSYLWNEPREYADFILRGIETKGTNKNEFDYKAISTAKSGTANKIRSSVKQ